MNPVFKDLVKNARYAIGSKSDNLVYETYGAAKMARKLDAISKAEFMELNTMLVKDYLNNPEARREVSK